MTTEGAAPGPNAGGDGPDTTPTWDSAERPGSSAGRPVPPPLGPAGVARLETVARRIRRRVLQTVHHAGAGHVGGPLSVVELLVTLYLHELNVDPARPGWADRDRLVFSKGHSAPALYAVLAELGYLPVEELATFDELGSRLQAHPDMTRLPGLDMSTGSLGQGLSVGVGMALAARLAGGTWRTHVVLGDGESQEGQVWEASFVAAREGLDNLVALLDWNHLQQYGWHVPGRPAAERVDPLDDPAGRWRAIGWHAIEADGHDIAAVAAGLAEARATHGRPTILVCRTVKGRGISFMEGNYLWHSRPVTDDDLSRALAELVEPGEPRGREAAFESGPRAAGTARRPGGAAVRPHVVGPGGGPTPGPAPGPVPGTGAEAAPGPTPTDPLGPPVRLAADRRPVAIRDAFGAALVDLGRHDPRVVVLDGDLANSTKVDAFADAYPERFFEMGIAEQNLMGVAAGLASTGLVPFATTFAAFVTFRDLDQVRVAVAQTELHVVIVGAYSGLLLGKPGKSHVCLEDLALMRALPGMTILSPGDPVETRLAVAAAAAHPGPIYLRVTRGPSPTLFPDDHVLRIGAPVLLRDGRDVALLTTGLQTARTLEAAERLAAEGIDALVLHLPTVKPLDAGAVVEAARRTGAVVTTEDHSIIGGLGSAVAEILAEHAPTPMRRIGTRDTWAESAPDEVLLEAYGLTAGHVVEAARELLRVATGETR